MIPAVVEYCDIAGIVKGAHRGEGLGNKFLSHIKDTQVLITVLRNFEDNAVINIETTVNPFRDWELIQAELSLKDLESVEKRLLSLEKENRNYNQEAAKNMSILSSVKKLLEKGQKPCEYIDEKVIMELKLLMLKKNLILLNGPSEIDEEIKVYFNNKSLEFIPVNLTTALSIDSLITRCYSMLNLVSYFTTGEDETRAWTITHGMKAPQAAGQIHSDFEKYFIRAEVVHFDMLKEAGSWTKAKQSGLIRIEGKEYVVADGDVMIIRHG